MPLTGSPYCLLSHPVRPWAYLVKAFAVRSLSLVLFFFFNPKAGRPPDIFGIFICPRLWGGKQSDPRNAPSDDINVTAVKRGRNPTVLAYIVAKAAIRARILEWCSKPCLSIEYPGQMPVGRHRLTDSSPGWEPGCATQIGRHHRDSTASAEGE